ncbi:MAG: hypothetical protein H7X93_14550 [Sphingomonadaceae bacterium]|nr:hypothetical protein [Sphingomonadaceae bacterium]
MISILDVDRGTRFDPRAQRRAERLRLVGIGILVPTVLALIYYALVARPEYATEMKFTIQGLTPQPPDLLSGIGIPAISAQGSDGQIIAEFVQSSEMVRLLEQDYGFDAAFGGPSLDPAGRISSRAAIEEKTDFWRNQATAEFDTVSSIITVNVEAFSPAESLRLAQGVLSETEGVVNQLNSRVQNEAVEAAEREVQARRREYDVARRSAIGSRASRATTIQAESTQQIGLIGQIEGALATARVERAASATTFRPDSPQIQALNERIATLEQQRAAAMAEIRGGPGSTEASRDVAAETAVLDYQFAQQAYYASIQARRAAQVTRENERRYLVAFVPPRAPETSNYWSRFANVIAVAIAAALLMAIGSLGYSIVKDHAQ